MVEFLSHMLIAHRSCGLVHVVAEEVADSKYNVMMELYAKKLDKKDFFGKVRSYKIVCSTIIKCTYKCKFIV